MKSTLACSHQVVASCHVIPSTVERDGRLLELDELPKHVSEPQSPVSLQPSAASCVVVTADLTTLYGCRSGSLCQKSWTAQVAFLFLCPQHVEDDPFFEGIQKCSVPRSIWAPQNCPDASSWPLCTGSPMLRYQCWSFSARKYPWIKIFQ